ncbi:ATP-binding protein [Sedimentitalea sp. HM32M-2]|uniref:sensor histidine kinase n=1 Tax=Sedimentitalea sp. HM32M-2 TaxID=3351566 RepID=UPI003643D0A2
MEQALSKLLLVYLSCTGFAGYFFYSTTFEDRLDQASQIGETRVEQAAERLDNQLSPFRILVNALASDPRVKRPLETPEDVQKLESLFIQYRLTYGIAKIEVVDAQGQTLVSTDPGTESHFGSNRSALTSAFYGQLGLDHVVTENSRHFVLARGVASGPARPSVAIVLWVSIAALEFDWAIVPEIIVFADKNDLVVASNRSGLLLKTLRPKLGSRRDNESFPAHEIQKIGDHTIWRFPSKNSLPRETLFIERGVPRERLRAIGFIDTAQARREAKILALLAVATTTVVAAALLLLLIWRHRVADRIAMEEAANAKLEERVEERTAELVETQNQLIQATKMTVLGQMSAGISHEVNQPLATISNFAENGSRLLNVGRDAEAKQNFEQIAEQAGRIGRIIKNLRAFARDETIILERVNFGSCVKEALALASNALEKAGVSLFVDIPDSALAVDAGRVRLQQVVMNIVTNAIDATRNRDRPEIHIRLWKEDGSVCLSIRDNGTGIEEPDRVFEPFYTTKSLGASEGLGLGLSVSYGIIGSFNGEISAHDHPSGGAVFLIRLPLSERRKIT